jgi:hypothetical protein
MGEKYRRKFRESLDAATAMNLNPVPSPLTPPALMSFYVENVVEEIRISLHVDALRDCR